MQKRPLGSTGMHVSPIGLGTVKLGRRTGLKYPSTFELPSDEQVNELFDCAKSLGINAIDTAPAYGTSEQRLGELLERRGDRDDWLLFTKAGEFFDDDTGASTFDFSERGVLDNAHRSLDRLCAAQVELICVHSDGNDEAILRDGSAIRALRTLRERGLTAAIGFSPKTPQGAAEAIEVCDIVMLELSLDRRAMLPLIVRARERGVGVLIKKALGSGHADPAASLRFALGSPWSEAVSSVIVGTINPEHLGQNVVHATDGITR
ncbi:MAG: aldo/keto reductase [Planctomycetota bacterium]